MLHLYYSHRPCELSLLLRIIGIQLIPIQEYKFYMLYIFSFSRIFLFFLRYIVISFDRTTCFNDSDPDDVDYVSVNSLASTLFVFTFVFKFAVRFVTNVPRSIGNVFLSLKITGLMTSLVLNTSNFFGRDVILSSTRSILYEIQGTPHCSVNP